MTFNYFILFICLVKQFVVYLSLFNYRDLKNEQKTRKNDKDVKILKF